MEKPKDNTGIPFWVCGKCGGHAQAAVSIPEGIDFSVQKCERCGLSRTAHNANGCMAWCCCVCEKCCAARAASDARIEKELKDSPGKYRTS